jgi:predicted transposase YbfD/YdcC
MDDNTKLSWAQLSELKSLAALFARLSDQRARRGVRYPLAPLLVLLTLAKLAGQDTPSAISEWVALRAPWLSAALRLDWKRMPHPSTYRRLLQRGLDLSQLEPQAGQFLASLGVGGADLLNLDGKSLRGTIPSGQTRGLHLLAVQQGAQNLVLAQTAVSSKENEISAAPGLLKQVEMRGKVVSGDALLAQKKLSRQIVRAGGDYLWIVKDNHPRLLKQLEAHFAAEAMAAGTARADYETAQSYDKGHGRIESRRLTSSSRIANTLDWPYLGQAFRLDRQVFTCRTQAERQETVYGLTSLPPTEAAPARLLALQRGHWSIENGLHYRRDVTFHEDACRMKSHRAAEALAVFNNLALGLMRHAGWENIAAARRHYEARLDEALGLILRAPS